MSLNDRQADRLHAALTLIGDTAASQGHRGVPMGSRTSHKTAVLALLAVAVSLLVLGWVFARGSSSSPLAGSTTSAQSNAEMVACAETILVGVPTEIEPGSISGRIFVTMEVTEWIKPDAGETRVVLNVPSPQSEGRDPWKLGVEAIVIAPENRRLAPDVFTGSAVGDTRRIIMHALPEGKTTECPKYWQQTDGQ